MNQTRGLPPYPPERDVWQYPPPQVSRRWFWVAIAALVGSMVAGVGLAFTAAFISSKDFPSLIEDHRVLTVITRECRIMTSSVESMPVEGTPKERVAILADQDRAVQRMLRAIRSIDPSVRAADRPTDAWLEDWDRLIKAREDYAALVGRGREPALRIPRDANGDRIHRRMDRVWLDSTACTVPSDLLDPRPKDVNPV